MIQYGPTVGMPSSPVDSAVKAFIQILQNSGVGFTVPELCENACNHDSQIAQYLGPRSRWSTRENKRLRGVVDRVLEHDKIKPIKMNPLVLQFLCDPCDPCDRETFVDNREKTG